MSPLLHGWRTRYAYQKPWNFFLSRKSQNSISTKNEMISQNTGTLTTFYTLISSIRDYITTLYSLLTWPEVYGQKTSGTQKYDACKTNHQVYLFNKVRSVTKYIFNVKRQLLSNIKHLNFLLGWKFIRFLSY